MNRNSKFLLIFITLMSSLYTLITLENHQSEFMNMYVTPELVNSSRYSDKKSWFHLQNLCDFYSEGVNIHNYHKLSDHTCKSLANSCQIHSCSAAIDVVVLWINMNDENIQLLYNTTYQSIKHSGYYTSHSISPSRFRDFNQLKYLLRSIEENGIEWARRIFLVTNNQAPWYLNISHPRIRVVSHEQLSKYTNITSPKHPLFNSIAIQSMVHNIPTLSSPFYLFDDDILIRKNLSISMIFDGNKSIVDLDATLYNIRSMPKSIYEAHIQSTIKMGLRKRSLDLLRNKGRYVIGFHGPLLLYREIGTKIWNEFRSEMNLTLSHPFRMPTDPSIQTLYIYIGYSDFYNFMIGRRILRFEMLDNADPIMIRWKLKRAFVDKGVYFVCINDDLPFFNKEIEKSIQDAYELIFPKVCSFENKS
jgi:hypothetical protein